MLGVGLEGSVLATCWMGFPPVLRNSCQITVEESPRGNPNNEAFSYFHVTFLRAILEFIFYFPTAWGMIALQARDFQFICAAAREHQNHHWMWYGVDSNLG